MREARTPKPLAEAEARPRLEALAESAWAQRDSDPALAQALAEKVFAESAHTPYGQALSLIIQAILAFRDARHDAALKSAFEAQLTLGADAAPVWHARLLNILGCIYLTLGERSLGLEHLHEQLTYAKAHKLATEIFLAHHDLGVYFSNAGEPVRAQEFFDEASRWLPSDSSDQAFLEMNLAYHYAGQTKFEEAMKHTELALALSRDTPKVHRLALETLAKVTLRQGDHTQTLQIYEELLAFDKANGFYLVHRDAFTDRRVPTGSWRNAARPGIPSAGSGAWGKKWQQALYSQLPPAPQRSVQT
jgi:tetratricopeptide (TPR) repeat protein